MSSHEPAAHEGGLSSRSERVRAYLRRFFTSWVAEDPTPEYSKLDRIDGLAQVPDPVCTPRVQLPESAEVAAHTRGPKETSDLVDAQSVAGERVGA